MATQAMKSFQERLDRTTSEIYSTTSIDAYYSAIDVFVEGLGSTNNEIRQHTADIIQAKLLNPNNESDFHIGLFILNRTVARGNEIARRKALSISNTSKTELFKRQNLLRDTELLAERRLRRV